MNFKKLKSIFCVIAAFFCLQTSFGLGLAWNDSIDVTNADPQMQVTGYRVYYGTSSHSYQIVLDAGSKTNIIISNSNFATNMTYYFAVTATNQFAESDFSAELAWTNSTSAPQTITFVGVKVDYGTNLTSINSTSVMVMSVTNHPDWFYNESLILTNNPITGGIAPVDGNRYLYFGTIMQYGSNLTSLTTNTFPLFTFTNPPPYFYRSSLVITNNPF